MKPDASYVNVGFGPDDHSCRKLNATTFPQ